MKFSELNLDEKIMQGIDEAGFVECTPVQEQTYEYSLKGRDVCVQSQTGTGKTAAFLISIFQNLLSGTRKGLSLIIVPTRELAVQIEDETQLLGANLGLKVVSIYGGVGYNKQEELLKNDPDIIIGTPGRLIDFGKGGKLKFEKVSTLVIDEADRLFDMGFLPDLRFMMKKMPGVKDRMTMLFSATLSSRVRQLAWEYMNDPQEIEISPETITVEAIDQELYHVSKEEKLSLLLGLLKKNAPENCLVFCNTKFMAVELSWRLTENGYPTQYLMGDLPQKKRLQVINKVKSGELRFLVATDVAARGLHIDDLSMVVNYDIPEDFENYVHRIGRTARAGKTGKAITLACEKYVFGLEAIEKYINIKIPVLPVDDELLAEDLSAGKHFRDNDRYIKRDRDDRRSGGRSGSRPGGRAGSRTGGKPDGRKTVRRPDRKPAGRAAKTSTVPSRTPSDGTDSRRSDNRRPVRPADKRRQAAPSGERTRNTVPGGRSRQDNRNVNKPKNGSTVDDRLAYYREKYGEDFKVSNSASSGDLPPGIKGKSKKGKAPVRNNGEDGFFSKLGKKLGIIKKKN